MHCDSGSFHFSTTLFFCSFLFSQYISFVANFDCYDYTLWMCSASECLCVCECFFLVWLVTAFKSVLLFQLKIIYFRVHWLSYQQKRFSDFRCVRARFFVFFFSLSILWQFGCGAKIMLKDTMHRYVKECSRILNGKLYARCPFSVFFGNVDILCPSMLKSNFFSFRLTVYVLII